MAFRRAGANGLNNGEGHDGTAAGLSILPHACRQSARVVFCLDEYSENLNIRPLYLYFFVKKVNSFCSFNEIV